MDCLDDAIALSELGFSVIPIRGKATRRKDEKTPAIKWTPYQTERADPHTIAEWFSGRDDLNVGVVCGTVSDRLVVRDFDHNDGFNRWREDHPALARELPQVRTSRGIHVYARIPGDEPITTATFSDGELRGDRAYVVAPPSLHPSGAQYRWVRRRPTSIPVVELDDLGFLPPGESLPSWHREDREHGGDSSPSLPPATAWEGVSVERYLPADEGQRHYRLFGLMLALRRLCRDATVDDARPLIWEWWTKSKPYIDTQEWFVTWADAADGWGKIRHMETADVAGDAFELAITRDPPACARELGGKPIQTLVAWCAELARLGNADDEFFLACRTVEEFIPEIPYRTAARVMRELCRCGILRLVRQGTKVRASRYRYLGGKRR